MWSRVKYMALLFFSFFLRFPGGLANKENAGEAEIFCQIRLLAENDPEKLTFPNEEREKQIILRVEKVGPEISSFIGEAHKRESSLMARFNDIVKEAEKLMGNVRDLRRKAAEKRLSAKRHLHQVIFGDYGGEGKGELDTTPETIKKIFSDTTFKDSCGGNGDRMAGKSLINDFMCLCVSRIKSNAVFQSSDDQSICKYGVDTAVQPNFSNWTDVWNLNNHRICINTAPLTPTPKNIHNLVALFMRAVEREQTGSQVKGVFGFVNSTGTISSAKVCDGNITGTGSVCINYKYALKNGGIQWVNHLNNASQGLDDMARYAEESESTLPQLELLEYNALLLYEEAKYSTHLPHATNETFINNISNKNYEEMLSNNTYTTEEENLEEEDDTDTTWKGGTLWWRILVFSFISF